MAGMYSLERSLGGVSKSQIRGWNGHLLVTWHFQSCHLETAVRVQFLIAEAAVRVFLSAVDWAENGNADFTESNILSQVLLPLEFAEGYDSLL